MSSSKPLASRSARIKSLSCQRCRSRKTKCDNQLPCALCVKEGIECVRIVSDRRKQRYSAEFIEGLLKKIETLEGMVENARGGVARNSDIKESSFSTAKYDEQSSRTPENVAVPQFEKVSADGNSSDPVAENRNLLVYGPTSVFDSQYVEGDGDDDHVSKVTRLQKDPHVLQCVSLFFRWQYPDLNSFVVREAFLLEFFSPLPKPIYCSPELILALCALGSRMSSETKIFNKSAYYYTEAKKIVLSKMDKPAIPTMQAYLLLSIFDISHGHNSSGWMLSGCGLRMGFDLGFQLDPTVWFLGSGEHLSDLNIAIRSRIYWGCYFADHFISLVLGRPSVLKLADSSLPETVYLPDLDWIADYTYLGPGANPHDKSTIIDVSDPLKYLVRLINISADMLHDVFTRDGSHAFDWKARVEKSQYFNNIILQWRSSLPDNLQWDRQTLEFSGENPTKMFLRHYYYILLLCLNRPFLEAANGRTFDLPSAEICDEVIDDLMISTERFRTVHGLRKCPIFIVYCSILCLSVLIIASLRRGLEAGTERRIEFYLNALHDSSEVWPLAEKSFRLICSKLEKTFKVEVRVSDLGVKIALPSLPKTDAEHNILHFLSGEQNGSFDNEIAGNSELFGGPPLLLTSDLPNQEYEDLFTALLSGYN